MKPACLCVGISVRTYQRWVNAPGGEDRRRGPCTPPSHRLSEEERRAVLKLVSRREYRNLSPEQVVAKAASQGIYVASESTIRRILKEHRLATYRGRAKPGQPRHKPKQFVACKPLQVLTWDITYLRDATVAGRYFFLYCYIDIWSRRILGWAVHEEQSAEHAGRLLRDLCAQHGIGPSCVVHSDNGGPMKGATMLATMQKLGIVKSFSRPGVSDDNPFIESLYRHLKYAPSYPTKGFATIDQARQWVSRFVDWYNHEHLHSSIAYVTPDDRHHGRDLAQLDTRRRVYEQARLRNPRRWTKPPRGWHRPRVVMLNPDRVVELANSPKATAA
jgi:transposase InsO family protein